MSNNATRPDRVVILNDTSLVVGGASKLALMLAAELAQTGVPVTLFSGDDGHAQADPGIDVIGLGRTQLLQQNKLQAASAGLWNHTAERRLKDWIAKHDTPDTIYHIHAFLQILSPSIFAALRPVSARTVVHAHDYFLACPNGAYFDYRATETCMRTPLSTACIARNCDKRSYAQKLWRVARQRLQNRATADLRQTGTVIAINAEMSSWLQRRHQITQLATIPNPAEPYLSTPPKVARNTGFFYVGDIHSYKGVFDLAEAGRRSDATVHFVGDGQDRAALQDAYPDAQFHGWQDRAGLAALMGSARAVVLPTKGPEPFGLVAAEALLSGLPVIASDSILLAKTIQFHDAGVTFRAGAPSDLAQVLARLSKDDALIERLAANAPEAGRAISRTPSAWRDETLALYSSLLSD